MIKTKKQIGIYKTGEYGADLYKQNLHETLLRNDLGNRLEIIEVSPKDVQNPNFFTKDLVGLTLPGRNSGQMYRDEWTKKGFFNIQNAVQNGLNIQATCAPTAVLSRQLFYYNAFDTAAPKYAENEYALFDGSAHGAFNLLPNEVGYRGKLRQADIYHSNVLAAKVMPLKFHADLAKTRLAVDGHGIYWGGCIWQMDKGLTQDQNVTILASHQSVINIPLYDPEKDVHVNKIKDGSFVQPAAIIEFAHGSGKVIFSNMHYEIKSISFRHLFHTTPQAQGNPERFEEDRQKLAASDALNDALFDRFVGNCLPEWQNNGLKDKKSLVVPKPQG